MKTNKQVLVTNKTAITSAYHKWPDRQIQEVWTRLPEKWKTLAIISTCNTSSSRLLHSISLLYSAIGCYVLSIDTCSNDINQEETQREYNGERYTYINTNRLGMNEESIFLKHIPSIIDSQHRNHSIDSRIILLLPSLSSKPISLHSAKKCDYCILTVFNGITKKSDLLYATSVLTDGKLLGAVYVENDKNAQSNW